ncbi:MAG: tRNA pseudouridine(38-40) synthase TruA [Spongiibacteraceae bacterium]|jgi:tRNA pseudouridine38-40 synthase|nr:tRNA pseudouridine(38-40) synthase TruA [Spongiibacteraceae bacterium]
MSEQSFAAPFTHRFTAGDRVALAVEYDGSGFYGWQSQRKLRLATVQETLEQALSRIAAAPIVTACAGRTDAGVHAARQIVHFDTPVARDEKAWVIGANTHLPAGIAVQWARPVAADFHARFTATARRYRYVILNRPVRSAHFSRLATTFHYALDADLMHAEAQCLLGEQDFSSFRGAGCQSSTPMRNVHFVSVKRYADWVVVEIQANAFLLHMVRNIVGTLMEVGCGRQPPGWTAEVFAARDRTRAAPTAPPQGLYLVDVQYPARYGLPETAPGPAFLTPLLMGV